MASWSHTSTGLMGESMSYKHSFRTTRALAHTWTVQPGLQHTYMLKPIRYSSTDSANRNHHYKGYDDTSSTWLLFRPRDLEQVFPRSKKTRACILIIKASEGFTDAENAMVWGLWMHIASRLGG